MNVATYFHDPHSPSRRYINENTGRLLCPYLPHGLDLSTPSQDQLRPSARRLTKCCQRT